MAKTIKEERLRWVLPIVHKEIKLVDVAKVCPYSKRSLERWATVYKKGGVKALEPKSTARKTQENETPIRIKEHIIELRKQTKKCALKLHWQMKKEGLVVPARTIGEILKREGLVRKYRVKRIKYKYLKAVLNPGELVEVDVKYVPGSVAGRQYFQYTAIDRASRWRHLEIYDEQINHHSVLFLEEIIRRAPFMILAIKTDNHSTFTNYYTGTNKRSDLLVKSLHALDARCRALEIKHYLIDPGKPAQNGTVERSHREDQEKLYDQHSFTSEEDLRYYLRLWNMYYNDLEHCGLNGKTPNEFLANYQLINPPNVPA
ncbi:MAG: DDE-type integrase/transposase/recombinase [bacterium]|nr:DDE-type integrase/transposase/recombinase [bacterium]